MDQQRGTGIPRTWTQRKCDTLTLWTDQVTYKNHCSIRRVYTQIILCALSHWHEKIYVHQEWPIEICFSVFSFADLSASKAYHITYIQCPSICPAVTNWGHWFWGSHIRLLDTLGVPNIWSLHPHFWTLWAIHWNPDTTRPDTTL